MSDECCSRTCPNPDGTPAPLVDEWGHTFCDTTCARDDSLDTWTPHQIIEETE